LLALSVTLVGEGGFEPPRLAAHDPKSCCIRPQLTVTDQNSHQLTVTDQNRPKKILKILKISRKYLASPLKGRVYHITTDTANQTPLFAILTTVPLTLPEYVVEVVP